MAKIYSFEPLNDFALLASLFVKFGGSIRRSPEAALMIRVPVLTTWHSGIAKEKGRPLLA
jgi:hypothetical protein